MSHNKATVYFSSSESFLEYDPKACEEAKIPITDYIEACYGTLRHSNGEEIAYFINEAWELPDGRRFSDWAVGVGNEH